ncbi:Metallo-dependent phosphatase-like [Phytophthora cactorum]|nr:Metallo-dependent phosphatase-like [Phytophthora cactorum]
MKVVVLVSALFTQLMLPCPATKFDPHYFRPIARVDLSEGVEAETGNDLVTPIICASTAATAFLGFECTSSTSSSSSSKAAATVSHTATYDLHALAIGDWGVDLGLGSCCNVYRKTGTGNKEYYKDQQAQINVAHLLTFDNFYWNGLGSDDVNYRFLNSFEAMYSDPALLNIKWFNVAGNHDIGGSMFICGKRDNQFVECSGKTDLLKQLDEKFTRQSKYVSPNNDRWQMPDRYYVETLEDPDSGVTVDVFNIDTNAAAVHGAQQTCCQCYGYKMKHGYVRRLHGTDRGVASRLSETISTRRCQIHATWKVVNTHYSPHFHMDPTMMAEVNSILKKGSIHLFMNGHTHAESHEFGSFNTHFVTNGAGGGIQSESIGEPPPYATEIKPIWRGENAPYGIFELSFAADQMKLQFVTFDDDWVFAANKANTVKGGAKLGHCWLIPKDGSLGEAPSLSMEFQECFSLLASRPAHAHEHCEQQQHAEDKPQDVNGVENEETVDSNESADLTQLSARALEQAFHGLQETRVQIYAEFRQCVVQKSHF